MDEMMKTLRISELPGQTIRKLFKDDDMILMESGDIFLYKYDRCYGTLRERGINTENYDYIQFILNEEGLEITGELKESINNARKADERLKIHQYAALKVQFEYGANLYEGLPFSILFDMIDESKDPIKHMDKIIQKFLRAKEIQ